MAETARRSEGKTATIEVAGAALLFDRAGAVYWPDEDTLIVADLHLEKGSSLAGRGLLVPPYDSAATLAALGRLIAGYRPRRVIALGDSFHDGEGPDRLDDGAVTLLAGLMCGCDWIWIAGNHDPQPPSGLPGETVAEYRLGNLVFRHEPRSGPVDGEVAGHHHPAARVVVRGHAVRRACFVEDGNRFVMPAFGALTGAVDIASPALARLFDWTRINAYLIGRERIYAMPGRVICRR